MNTKLLAGLILSALLGLAQTVATPDQTPARPVDKDQASHARSGYVLGPDDQIIIRVADVEEVTDKPLRIDMSGFIRLPMVGRVETAGRTAEQLEAELVKRYRAFVRNPDITVSIAEFRSQPVSLIGAVKAPGVHQVQGRKTLVEMLSLAGGLEQNAGSTVKITRRREWGRIPLKDASTDPTGEFSVAEVNLKAILEAKRPEENVLIKPYDVISVPKADIVYVTGEVQKSGGFLLNEQEKVTVLQALSLAGGLDRAAAPQNSRILRSSGGASRAELAVNLRKILQGKEKDVLLQPGDILFIPSSAPKKAAVRVAEAAIQAGTGIVIWRR